MIGELPLRYAYTLGTGEDVEIIITKLDMDLVCRALMNSATIRYARRDGGLKTKRLKGAIVANVKVTGNRK